MYIVKMIAARRPAPFYRLAQRDTEGRLFILTGRGEFKSGLAAQAAWLSSPRNGVALILEHRDLGFGLTQKIVATAGAI